MSTAALRSFPSSSAASTRQHAAGFWFVALTFLVVGAFSTVPSPLYAIYQERDGFSSFTITLIYAAYAVGVATSLFLAGHVSDWIGRRRVLLSAVGVSILSAIVFLAWRDLPGLILARVINGLSVGAVAATATAWLAELHAAHRPGESGRRAQLVATTVNVGGLGIGALVSGMLAEWVADPLTVPYLVFLAGLIGAALMLAATPETAPIPDPRPTYRPQRVAVPPADRARYFAAAVAGFFAFGANGFFTALAPTVLAGSLGHTSRALAGATIFVMFGAGVAFQVAFMATEARRSIQLGLPLIMLGLAVTTLSLWLPDPSLALFLAGGALVGGGAGLLFKGSVATVVQVAPAESRAEALAGFFLAAYVGLSVPVIAIGVALQSVSPKSAVLGFALVVAAALAAAARPLLRGAAR